MLTSTDPPKPNPTLGKRSRQPGVAEEKKGPKTPGKNTNAKSNAAKSQSKGTASTPTSKKPVVTVKALNAQRNTFEISVDFGTTYSGVAIGERKDGTIIVLDEWTGTGQNAQLQKVPTKIAFASENKGLKEDKWGHGVKAEHKSYSWFKLSLDDDAAQTAYDSDILSGTMSSGLLELPSGMTAEQLVTAYLKKLYQHIMEYLERTTSKATLKTTPINFWFTHPATWEDTSVDKTLKAAYKAGFGTREEDELHMITEPEAAAIAILNQKSDGDAATYQTCSNVLVADLGGGTLDFQCLTIESLDPLRTEETIPGMGGKSGSVYIDCKLHEWLADTFGLDFTNLPPSKIGPGSALMREFENIKKAFDGKDMDETYGLVFPALGNALRERKVVSTCFDVEDGEVRISAKVMAMMFQPVLDAAYSLMDAQLAALKRAKKSPFDVVCLCGGLGSSIYVHQKFKEYCKEKLKGACIVVTDTQAWSAVARGAAARGLEGSIVLSKRAKRYYGIGVHLPFRSGVDKEKDAFMCPIGGKRAEGYVKWIVKKGQRFTPNFEVYTKVYVPIEVDDEDDDLEFTWKLYTCAADEAPVRIGQKGVDEIGSIKLDLSKTHKRRKTKSDGSRAFESADLKVLMRLGNEKGVLDVEARHNRKSVGTAKIDYGKTHIKRTVRSAGLR